MSNTNQQKEQLAVHSNFIELRYKILQLGNEKEKIKRTKHKNYHGLGQIKGNFRNIKEINNRRIKKK